MKDLLVHIAHLLTTMAKLLRRGDAKIVVAEVKNLAGLDDTLLVMCRSGDEPIYHVKLKP